MSERTSDDEGTEAIESPARRELLRSVLTGAGLIAGTLVLPRGWSRPEVMFGVLPAHATLSEDYANAGNATGNVPNNGTSGNPSAPMQTQDLGPYESSGYPGRAATDDPGADPLAPGAEPLDVEARPEIEAQPVPQVEPEIP